MTGAPSAQAALDIFRGEWASALPHPLAHLRAGVTPLFADARLAWGLSVLGGVTGLNVLELGPLEGGHTYMLDRAGAATVTAIEANPRAFLRCLLAKDLLGIPAARFLCGDFLAYLKGAPERFDLAVASGVLYHMRNPAELIARLAGVCDGVIIWTHYHEPLPTDRGTPLSYEDFSYTGYRHAYGLGRSAGFCGAGTDSCSRITRADLQRCLAHFGFADVVIGLEARGTHEQLPHLTLVARKRRR